MRARQLLGVAVVVTWVAVGCARSIRTPEMTTVPVPVATARPETAALQAAEVFLESYLGHKLGQLEVAYGTAEWPDAALGCPEPGVDYPPVTTSGYAFEVTVDGVLYNVHASADGTRVVLCPSAETGTKPGSPQQIAMEAAKALLSRILGANPLQIGHPITTEAAQWAGHALGCPAEGQAYEEVELSGFRFQFVYAGGLYDVRASGDGGAVILCGDAGPVTEEQQGRLSESSEEAPQAIQRPLEAAIGVLAQLADLSPQALALESVEWQQLTFDSSALGCPEPETAYLDVLTDGFAFWLGYVDQVFEIHTDVDGNVAVLCEDSSGPAGGQPISSGPTETGPLASFSNQNMGFGISYPHGWWVAADPVSGETLFRPGNSLPTFGMEVKRLASPSGDIDTWLASYQQDLGAVDPTVSQDAVVQTVGTSGRSQRFNLDLRGTRVVERVTFFSEGFRIRQWAPADQWGEWDRLFVQMLARLVFLAPE